MATNRSSQINVTNQTTRGIEKVYPVFYLVCHNSRPVYPTTCDKDFIVLFLSMISMVEKNKRGYSGLGLSIVLLLTTLVLLDFNLEFSGTSVGFVGIGIFLYWLGTVVFQKVKKDDFSTFLTGRELSLSFLLIAVLSLMVAIESFQNYTVFTIIFLQVFILNGVLYYVNVIQKKPLSSDTKNLNQLYIPSWIYWAFIIGNGFLIVYFEDYFSENKQFGMLFLFYVGGIGMMFLRWIFNQIQTIILLKKEQTKTELLHLQSQVNPHFFFNMLNNLYGWVGKDPKVAQEMILNLSEMMRYSIYDGQEQKVLLENEVDYLKNYINLHKSRYHKPIDISFETDIDRSDYEVMPLLFIILVENAFKHGVENLRKDAFVKINLSAKDHTIICSIENNFDPSFQKTAAGIGLANLKRRLELVYPEKHELELIEQETIYKAILTINLK